MSVEKSLHSSRMECQENVGLGATGGLFALKLVCTLTYQVLVYMYVIFYKRRVFYAVWPFIHTQTGLMENSLQLDFF